MKFRELVDKYVWDDVWPVLLRLYPDEEQIGEGYRQVYATLRSLQPAESKLRICIETVTDDFDGATYEDVSGKDGTTNRESAPEADWDDERGNEEASFGIEFTDWAEWLGMEIDPETVARYSEPEIIGHCLWEMTFYGFSQEKIQKFIDDMEESVRSGERHTVEDVEKLFDDMEYKGYLGQVQFDDEAGFFHGEVINIRDVITFQGRSVEELRQALEDSVEDYLEFCAELGKEPEKPFSGRVTIRLSPEQHRKVVFAAAKAGEAVERWIAEALDRATGTVQLGAAPA